MSSPQGKLIRGDKRKGLQAEGGCCLNKREESVAVKEAARLEAVAYGVGSSGGDSAQWGYQRRLLRSVPRRW